MNDGAEDRAVQALARVFYLALTGAEYPDEPGGFVEPHAAKRALAFARQAFDDMWAELSMGTAE